MKYNNSIILCTLLLLTSLFSLAQEKFVKVSGHQFYVNNKPYYYIGTNYWYGSFLGLELDKKRGIERLQKELDFLNSKGVNNLRVIAGAEGYGKINGVERISPSLQPEQGLFNENILEGLDLLLFEMGKRNMKAIIFFSNNWEWSGGFQQYLTWNGLVPDSLKARKLNWDEQRDIVSKFYTCQPCKEDYLKQVNLILSRTNKYTRKNYKEDPAIMAWELANEPRPMRPAVNEAYKQWISETAAFIKSKDNKHLVTIGHEGEMGSENLQLFENIHADKNIDYLTIHIWPKNWSWFRDTSIQKDFQNVSAKTIDYINKHEAIAQKLQKPLVIEEFGLPRNQHSFDVHASTSLRDSYYNTIFSTWQKSRKNNGVIAGANFWAFGGIARPIPGQTFWKKGDELMGDPPMEEQGLNTVFDRDRSTWDLIESYTKNKHPQGNELPVDKNATVQTINLYNNLKRLLHKGIMFGHQDALAYGVGWKYKKGRSDIKEVTGEYPAVYGWELGGLELDQAVNLDSVPFEKMKGYIKEGYERGGVITISWHLHNPLTGKTAWDPEPGTVASILPGGSKHELYKSWLDKIALFMNDLKGAKGEFVPVLFRPFHELNGSWFWWGKNHCTPEEVKAAYQFTVTYLRDEKNLHHLLYAFNTDRFVSEEEYVERYPGDEYTDVIGFDIYQRNHGRQSNEQFIKDISSMLTMLEDIANKRGKIPALTEFGYAALPDSTWWTNVFWKALQSHKISYALGWRNAGYKPESKTWEFYVPYKGQASAKDFVRLYGDKRTLFQKDVVRERLYDKPKSNVK
jgi:mannan endo-1,4-beta-mannosidase